MALVVATLQAALWTLAWVRLALTPRRPRHGSWLPPVELSAVLGGPPVPPLRPRTILATPSGPSHLRVQRWRPLTLGMSIGAMAGLFLAAVLSGVSMPQVHGRSAMAMNADYAAAQRSGDLPGEAPPSAGIHADTLDEVASSPVTNGGTAPVPSVAVPVSGPATVLPAIPRSPAKRGALPVGKGMWIYMPDKTEGGNVGAIVRRAKATNLTHIYVRTGSSKTGFYAASFLNSILPAAHRAGLRVYAWDFPYLDDVQADIARAQAAIAHVTPSGDRVDGFSADIELPSMGVKVTPENARAYGSGLRASVGPKYPLIATVPRPSPVVQGVYPFKIVTESFDAIAPMVYWLNRDPAADMRLTAAVLGPLGKPLIPVGQAYDGSVDGAPGGMPSPAAIQAFIREAEARGAIGVSFWSWQHANGPAWGAIQSSQQFSLPTDRGGLTSGALLSYQALLTSLGFPAPMSGRLDDRTVAALRSFQQSAHIRPSGTVDANTRTLLLAPVAPPLDLLDHR